MAAVHSIESYVREAQSSFYYPMLLVPRAQRDALRTVYAFCRYTDDVVDRRLVVSPREFLVQWKKELSLALEGRSQHIFLNKLRQVVRTFAIPVDLLFELIHGIEMDLYKSRYRTFDELYQYCYRVASTVGLMVVHILGRRTAAAQAYAVHTGIALQLTNIIRDVVSDFRRGRVYLPVEDMEQFGVSESDFGKASGGEDVILFLRHQCSRARSYYVLADEAYEECRSYALFPARAMQNLYERMLTRIEADFVRVLQGRVDLSVTQKVRVLVRTWLEERSHG